MACNVWREKLEAYLDGEVEPRDATELTLHMRSCAACAAEAVERMQLKRAIAVAGKRYEPGAQLRALIAQKISTKPQRRWRWQWVVVAVPALAVVIISILFNTSAGRENARRERVFSELADLHVAALASATPVDVVSTDRHTVKPWFEGKVPFSFNLPELQGTDFTLLGGRVTYLNHTSGAQLLYQLRKHRISVFIFPDGGPPASSVASAVNSFSFNMESWSQNGLRYFVVGDVGAADIQALTRLLQGAG